MLVLSELEEARLLQYRSECLEATLLHHSKIRLVGAQIGQVSRNRSRG